ncbi:MAG: ATPase, partial [Mycobacteriales bacterium]
MTDPSGAVDPLLLERVRRRVGTSGRPPSPAAVAQALRREGGGLHGEVGGLLAGLQSEIVGAGPLTELLADPAVTDVLVNGAGQVWVDRGSGLVRTPV